MEDIRCKHISLKKENKGKMTCSKKIEKDGLCKEHLELKERLDKKDKEIPRIDVLKMDEFYSKDRAFALLNSTYFRSDDKEKQKELEIQKSLFKRYIDKSEKEGELLRARVHYDRKTYGRFNNRIGRNDDFVLRWSGTNMSSKIRNTLFYDRYYDLDFVNCHPSISYAIFSKYNLPTEYTRKLIEDRDYVLSYLGERTGLDRKACKTLPLIIFYGGKYIHWLEENIHPSCLSDEDIQHLNNLEKEVHSNIRVLLDGEYNNYLTFAKRVKTAELNYKDEWYRDIYCIAWAYLCQDLERQAIELLINAVQTEGIKIGAIIHDGFHLEKKYSIEEMEKSFFDKWKTEVREGLKKNMDLDIDLNIIIKPMEAIEIVPYIQPVEVEEEKTYQGVKLVFEKSSFFLSKEGKYCSVFKEGDFVLQNKTIFKDRFENMKYEEKSWNEKKEKYEVKKASFIKRWFLDEDKKTYTQARVYPPPMKCPEDEYNLWTGFKAQITEYPMYKSAEDYAEGVECILNHIKYLGGEGYEYILKVQALYAQKPGFKHGVMLTYKSDAEGIGKSSMSNLTRSWMGERWCSKIENPEAILLGNFNSIIEGKVYIFLEEFDGSVVYGRSSKILMELITSSIDTINKKGVSAYDIPSFTHYEGSTNTLMPKKISDKNRRDCFFEIKGDAKPKEYFDTLYKNINDPYVMKAWYEYLLTINIENVDWIRDRPISEMQEDLMEASQDLEKVWLYHYFLKDLIRDYSSFNNLDDYKYKMKTDDLFNKFRQYLGSNCPDYNASSITSFGMKLKKYKLDCWVKSTYKPTFYKTSLVDTLKELIAKKIYADEIMEEMQEGIKTLLLDKTALINTEEPEQKEVVDEKEVKPKKERKERKEKEDKVITKATQAIKEQVEKNIASRTNILRV